jgi:hypothetical protein
MASCMLTVIAMFLVSLEVLLVTWLVLVISYGGGFFFIFGLVLYSLVSVYLRKSLKSIILMMITAVILAWSYSMFGLVAALLAYVALIVLGEYLPFVKDKDENSDDL